LKNGDISNETPARLIVLADVVAVVEVSTNRKLFKTSKEFKVSNLKKLEVSQLWTITNRYGLSVELAGIEELGWTQEGLDKVMEILDRRGGNPFNFAQLYSTTQELVDDMPYRVNLRGVVDVTGRAALYGSYGTELKYL
jgi:hypothetical protein